MSTYASTAGAASPSFAAASAPPAPSRSPSSREGAAGAASRTICVVGLGYIGLPTASLLAAKGFDVHGVDVSEEIVGTLSRGDIHIREPELDVLVRSAVHSGRLVAHTAPQPADVFLLAVPTPVRADRSPDLSAVLAAATSIVPVLRPGNLVIVESTCPVGTTDGEVAAVLEASGLAIGEDLFLAYCPERVIPGRILTELVENDRTVGGVEPRSAEVAAEFYRSFARGEVVETDSRTAEMVKLAENAFRDVNVAFANELSVLCTRHGVSIWDLVELANRHPRVDILRPGPGVGGHCIPVDPWFLVHGAPDEARLIASARAVNDAMPERVLDRVAAACERVWDPVIACLGLAYKGDVDDVRSSPAVEVARGLRDGAFGELLVVEPHLDGHPEFELVPLEEALERADIVVVLTDHAGFRRVRREDLHEKILIDTRGLYR